MEQAGFRDAKAVELFDSFDHTSKHDIARKFGVQGVNFLALKA
jgi:hypothetical protein